MPYTDSFKILVTFAVAALLVCCMDYGPRQKQDPGIGGGGPGVFIVNEGNFTYGNASLSYYDPTTGEVGNEVFVKVNAFKLGDVAQSMAIRDGKGYIVVNNSGIIFVIDTDTFEWVGEIKGLTSPRYIHFVEDSDGKAYVTDLHAPTISVVDTRTLTVTGTIATDVGGRTQRSTERMVQYGRFVFTNCWSYDNRILVIDTHTDSVVDEITVGKQPTSLAIDRYGMIWTVTDGGFAGSVYGNEPGRLFRIDAATRRVVAQFDLPEGNSGSDICVDGEGENIYFISKHVWKMDVLADELPREPFLRNNSPNYWYGLGIDPVTSHIYLADAVNYTQAGMVYRYSPQGELMDSFRVGVIPTYFCFKPAWDE